MSDKAHAGTKMISKTTFGQKKNKNLQLKYLIHIGTNRGNKGKSAKEVMN